MSGIDARTTMGTVHLRVSDLQRAVAFYDTHLGLTVTESRSEEVTLGAGESRLLTLRATPDPSRSRGTTGLYHFALLVPTRQDLALALQRLVQAGTRLHGFADHGVSEALYLADPDDNGIEIYRDRPRSEWPRTDEGLQMTVDPLDVDELLLAAGPAPEPSRLPTGTVMGHVHLHVSDLPSAHEFYVDVLGFDETQRYGSGALFVSAGGYHHHVGLNTWAGVGAPAPPPTAVGLDRMTVVLPDAAALERVHERVSNAHLPISASDDGFLVTDPSGNVVAVTGPGTS